MNATQRSRQIDKVTHDSASPDSYALSRPHLDPMGVMSQTAAKSAKSSSFGHFQKFPRFRLSVTEPAHIQWLAADFESRPDHVPGPTGLISAVLCLVC